MASTRSARRSIRALPNSTAPPPDRGSIIQKVILFGDQGPLTGEYPSKQIVADPFGPLENYGNVGLRKPPYSLEELSVFVDAQPIHESALRQKTNDVVGSGPSFIPDTQKKRRKTRGVSNDDPGQRDLMDWWNSIADPQFTMVELLQCSVLDFNTMGMGYLEIARDVNGRVRRSFYVPGHTIRAHYDGQRYAQWRNGRIVWFKRYGVDQNYYAVDGEPCPPGTPIVEMANELWPLRSPSRLSTWYGVPTYMSGVGWIALSGAARDWNLLFFNNHREPRHLIIISGIDEQVAVAADKIEAAIRAQLGEPHHNMIIPIEGTVNITIQKMSITEDLNFDKLIERCDSQTVLSHRVPPDRLGIVRASGLVGGSTSQIINVENAIYKAAVVSRDQAVLEDRVDRFIKAEYTLATGKKCPYHSTFEELDISDEAADANIIALLTKNCLITLNEGRERLGEDPREEFSDMTYMEYLISIGVAPQAAAGGGQGIPGGMHAATNNPGLQPPERMFQGEPEQGRPPEPGQPHNPQDNVTKAAMAEYVESRLANYVDDHVMELLQTRGR